MPTLTPDERNAVMDSIIDDLHGKDVLELFEEPEDRRRLTDYAAIADELGFSEPLREEYPVDRSLSELRRVLAEWRDIADDWLQHHADAQESKGVSDVERAQSREEHRVELWVKCQAILDRLGEGG